MKEVRCNEKISALNAQTANLLLAVNTEAKANLLRIFPHETIITESELHRLFLQSQGKIPGWNINSRTLFKYCNQDFEPQGLVNEVSNNRITAGYILNPLGIQGQLLAGLMLDFLRRYPQFTFDQLFGPKYTSSKLLETLEENTIESQPIKFEDIPLVESFRSPVFRFNIYWHLIQANLPIREKDLVEAIKTSPRRLSTHLLSLKRNNIITYHSPQEGEEYILYQITEKPSFSVLPQYKNERTLTRYIYELLAENFTKPWRIEEVIDAVFKARIMVKPASILSIESRIRNILNHLRKNGFVYSPSLTRDFQSVINLTNEQKVLLTDLIETVIGFQEKDPKILERCSILPKVLTGDYISKVMERAHQVSSQVNKSSPQTSFSYIIEVVRDYPDLTCSDIVGLIKERYGKSYSLGRMRELLVSLRGHKLESHSDKGKLRWRIKGSHLVN